MQCGKEVPMHLLRNHLDECSHSHRYGMCILWILVKKVYFYREMDNAGVHENTGGYLECHTNVITPHSPSPLGLCGTPPRTNSPSFPAHLSIPLRTHSPSPTPPTLSPITPLQDVDGAVSLLYLKKIPTYLVLVSVVN